MVCAVLWLTENLIRSRVGRAFCAVHHNELAAGSVGVDRAATKRLAFVLSGLLAGLAGGFYAHLVGYLGPDSFDLSRSINILVMAIVGGLGSTAGQVLGATLFTILPERLQIFADYQFIAYGLILTLTVTLLPARPGRAAAAAGPLRPAGPARRRAALHRTGAGPCGGRTARGGRRHHALRRPGGAGRRVRHPAAGAESPRCWVPTGPARAPC